MLEGPGMYIWYMIDHDSTVVNAKHLCGLGCCCPFVAIRSVGMDAGWPSGTRGLLFLPLELRLLGGLSGLVWSKTEHAME